MFISIDLDKKTPCRNCPHLLQMVLGGKPFLQNAHHSAARRGGRRKRADCVGGLTLYSKPPRDG
jgi:hypothetical protein